ncbi:Oidioi.mRNA.OKI2018_I69.chr2.g5106.t1.cds [Oikopleura dioica]|uniref:Oidioi.mRNA.OKI2018_I69.chr2.g5106.t1.cds n=1 Tax=Oikopleura dioica TaxID=34765 RepID=A0ABN7T513_OIKDI|nr:Oidioi.mRNA.OKI2018_I69.chr2.g5106.t1.cds [Oikopleura dioica]
MGNNGSTESNDSGYVSANSGGKFPSIYPVQILKQSVSFASQKRSSSAGESTWKKIAGGRKRRSKVIPSQSMPENVKVVNNYDLHRNRPPKTNSSYKIEVENPHYEMSANFAKSCSVSGLAAIHKNINLSRLPTSKTNYNLNKHPSTVKKVTMTGSTSEMLLCLANFVNSRSEISIEADKMVLWLRNVDRHLLNQGWQDCVFIGPTALVLMFLRKGMQIYIPPKLIKIDLPRRDPRLTIEDIRKRLLTYLYITYSYAGPEISYPVKPFMCLSTESSDSFWNRCLHLSIRSSDQLLRLATDPNFFARCFRELKLYQERVFYFSKIKVR